MGNIVNEDSKDQSNKFENNIRNSDGDEVSDSKLMDSFGKNRNLNNLLDGNSLKYSKSAIGQQGLK